MSVSLLSISLFHFCPFDYIRYVRVRERPTLYYYCSICKVRTLCTPRRRREISINFSRITQKRISVRLHNVYHAINLYSSRRKRKTYNLDLFKSLVMNRLSCNLYNSCGNLSHQSGEFHIICNIIRIIRGQSKTTKNKTKNIHI